MFSPLRISLTATLLLTFGILLTQTANSVAGDGHHHLKPTPEAQHNDADHANCPSCQNSMTVDGQGYGHCNSCNHRGLATGWCPPGKIRIRRERVQFNKYYPNYWSGRGPGAPQQYAPMVYTPTDTSQLGYYYQHAPSWTAQPNRIPGAPHPAAWHNRFCGTCNQGGQGGAVYYEYQGGHQVSPGYHYAPQLASEIPQASIELPSPGATATAPLPKLSALPDAPPEA